MSIPEDDLTTDEADADSARLDAPTAVSSGSTAPAPPKRPGRSSGSTKSVSSKPRAAGSASGPKTVAASTSSDTVVEPVTTDGDEERVRRPRRPKARPARAPSASRPPGTRPTAALQSERRLRQTVVKIDLWSVTKLSLCFYLSAMFVTLVALIALWVIADVAGYISSVEEFFGDLLSAEDFTFLSAEVLRGTILVGLVVVALQVVITVVAVSFYNIFAELFGGVEITVKEEAALPGD